MPSMRHDEHHERACLVTNGLQERKWRPCCDRCGRSATLCHRGGATAVTGVSDLSGRILPYKSLKWAFACREGLLTRTLR
jgi:hypothetical protein